MRIILRRSRANRYTVPVLLNIIERCPELESLEVHLAWSVEEVIQHIRTGGPTLIGYSFMTPQLEEVRGEVSVIREHMSPDDILVAGGAHPSSDPKGTARLGFDVVVVGGAEGVLRDLILQWIKEGASRIPRFWRSTDHSGLDWAIPVSRRFGFMAPLEITRGCPHECLYCQTPRIHPRPPRHRSIQSVREYLRASVELGKLVARFIAPDAFSYREPSLGDELQSLKALVKECREMGVNQIHLGDFPSEVRPERISPEFLELVVSQCSNRKIVIGAQSGSDRLLKQIRRAHNSLDVLKGVEMVASAGLLAHVDMLFGLPGETEEDRVTSIRFMERLIRMGRVRIHAHIYIPLPGTPLFFLDPPTLEEWFLERLEEMEADGAVDGNWKSQGMIQRKILQWRDHGLIGTLD